MASKNISFVTQADIDEKRKKRQEEWEKTRKEGDPEEAPEEVYDPRTLYERLQEQKMKKQEEFDESRKMKNLIKGLDNDEIEFLQAIDSSRAEMENQKFQEELLAIEEYKRQATTLSVEDQEKRLLEFKRELFQMHQKKSQNDPSKRKATQAELLSKLIKRKPQDETKSSEENKKIKLTSNSDADNREETTSTNNQKPIPASNKIPTIQCIGRLPGIGSYDGDSDSDESSDTEDDLEDFRVFADPHDSDH